MVCTYQRVHDWIQRKTDALKRQSEYIYIRLGGETTGLVRSSSALTPSRKSAFGRPQTELIAPVRDSGGCTADGFFPSGTFWVLQSLDRITCPNNYGFQLARCHQYVVPDNKQPIRYWQYGLSGLPRLPLVQCRLNPANEKPFDLLVIS